MAKQHRTQKSNISGSLAGLRVIGGRLRGRKLLYSGDFRTRPMKDRLREAIFNLIGPAVSGKYAVDLFAGTGALGIEALSRGAERAILIEQHRPTAAIVQQNINDLDLQNQAEVVFGNTFIWWKQTRDRLPTTPWAVFCSPPYSFFVDRADDMLALIREIFETAPTGSIVVVEADERFDFLLVPDAQAWDVRSYPPAVVGIYRKA
jgi:16S rRNA (guanine966-N2)-methyltransferase